MKKTKKYYFNKNLQFFIYWEPKRKKRGLFALKEALSFSIPYTILIGFWDYHNNNLNENKLLFHFLFTLIIVFLKDYYFTYKANEKKYQQYKKERY